MITITGATGHLGRLIIERLLPEIEPSQIRALARTPEKAADLAEKGIDVRQGDYENPVELEAAFEGSDVLMFISNADLTRRKVQHQNVVDAAKKAAVGRVVYTSITQSGSEDPLTRSHADTETYIEASGLPYTFLRDNFYMDLYVGEVAIAMEKGVYRTPRSPDAGAALVARTDIARAAAVVLTGSGHAGKSYDMTGPAPVTPVVIAETAAEISGKPVAHQTITWEELARDYEARKIPPDFIQLAVSVERFMASNKLSGVSDDIAKLTGQAPEDFRSFVSRELAK